MRRAIIALFAVLFIRSATVLFAVFFIRPTATYSSASVGTGSSAAGTESSKEKTDKQILLQEGLRYFYNSEYGKAEEKFDECIAIDPEDTVCRWRKAYSLYVKLCEEQKVDEPKLDKREFYGFISLIDEAIAKSEAKEANGSSTDLDLYVMASLYCQKGILERRNGSWDNALGDGLRCMQLAKRSKYQDAKWLTGFMSYKVSEQSLTKRIAATIAGLPHDRENGLSMIAEAAKDNDGAFADDVWLLIFKILANDKISEKKKASDAKILGISVDKVFARLYAKYPKNKSLRRYLDSKD